MFLQVAIAQLLIVGNICFMIDSNSSSSYDSISDYLKIVAEYYSSNPTTITITTNDKPLTSEIISKFVQDLSLVPVTITTQRVELFGLQKPKCLFVFVEEVEEFINGVRDAEENMMLWHLRGKLHVIICKPVNDTEWVKPLAEELWQSKVLDFIIVYYLDGLESVEYNPFLDQITQVLPSPSYDPFSKKLQNIHGHLLKVSMFPDPPRVVQKPDGLKGTDVTILTNFMQKINATLEIVIARGTNAETYFDEYYLDVTYGFVDFGFMSSFSFDEQNDDIKLKFTYPNRMDNVVVVVPRSEKLPQYRYIFLVFGLKVWISILGSVGVVSLFQHIFNKMRDSVIMSSFFDAYGIILGQSATSLIKGTAAVKALLVIWIYASMIFNVAFQCSLTSIIITPKYEKNIDTLKELYESKYKIMINPYHIKNVPEFSKLREKMIVEYESAILDKLMRGDTDKAYAVQLSIAEAIVSEKYVGNLPVYHIVEEYLVPGLSIYVFPVKSPYLSAADKYLLMDQQFGISAFNKKTPILTKTSDSDGEDVPLNLDHLQTAFYILFIGYIASTIAFILEFIGKYYIGQISYKTE